MRLRQIEVFHAIYTTGSISAAARSLHVSQPSVSKVLHHTQYQLGFELFKLVRGRLVATDEAHALFVEVKDIYGRMLSLRKAVSNIRDIGGGHIRLAVVPSLGQHVVPGAITAYRQRHPDITFDVQTLHHGDLFQALYERECDIAIAYNPPQHPRMQRRVLGQGQLMLLFDTSQWPDPPARIPMRWLQDRDMVGMASSGPIGDLFASEVEHQGIHIREVVSNQTYALAAALTRCGAGMSVMDEFTACANAGGRLLARPLEPAIDFRIECVHLEDRPPSKPAIEFIRQFQRSLAENRDGPDAG
ncbi:LysR family transcriptional regulator [Stenotrophomonas mori]|uniref:LysR family transcriptional regulator n=1 Tax=Stenotrophomonas mori TaxID=2871096 RepID=A0ABT0SIC4_9GAMM|nr:LysR family transcriptional regulator [Stenotrophomonas mori]MCL7715092.1 LysR family transcriptional regulator [Stenotrophomonas mori]